MRGGGRGRTREREEGRYLGECGEGRIRKALRCIFRYICAMSDFFLIAFEPRSINFTDVQSIGISVNAAFKTMILLMDSL